MWKRIRDNIGERYYGIGDDTGGVKWAGVCARTVRGRIDFLKLRKREANSSETRPDKRSRRSETIPGVPPRSRLRFRNKGAVFFHGYITGLGLIGYVGYFAAVVNENDYDCSRIIIADIIIRKRLRLYFVILKRS